MNGRTDQELLRDYSASRSEPAFAELARRHVDLVYSAALRMLRDAHQAEDVTQGVFMALAQTAAQLTEHPVLSGWLHRTARNLAVKAIRTDARRRAREHEAATMNELLSGQSDANWEQIAPHLDAALGELDDPDRDALLLRYFERKSAREMAETLGISDEAAQKRVSRATERLREVFAKRGIAVGAGGLAVVLAANTVQSAPVGLVATISAAAAAGAAVTTATIATTATTIAMTTLQKVIVATTIAIVTGAGIYEAHQASQLRDEMQELRQQQAPLAAQIQQLQQERDDATNRLAGLREELAAAKKSPAEVVKLRGEVGQLRRENADINSTSPLSKITASPEMKKMVRDQQKATLKVLYAEYAKQLNLSPEMTDKFNDMMADHVMSNIDLITQTLHDGKSQAEINQIFAASHADLQQQIQAMLGNDALTQYNDYTQNLGANLTAKQFAANLTGDDTAKQEKEDQLRQLVLQSTATALSNAGLPPNYQIVPTLNFANIASEDQGNQSLDLLDTIFSNVVAGSSAFLSPEEQASLQTFRTNAINNNRMGLILNRKLMSPLSQQP
jgi:RNA polymerase sigma factor (sigma-70 family)